LEIGARYFAKAPHGVKDLLYADRIGETTPLSVRFKMSFSFSGLCTPSVPKKKAYISR